MSKALPVDWPSAGNLDLALHDAPHASSELEWWYVNCHLDTGATGRYSLFAAFFRIADASEGSDRPQHLHSLTWALTDVDGRAHRQDSRVDPGAPRSMLRAFDSGRGLTDERIDRAVVELLRRGKVPLPDRFIAGAVKVAEGRLDLDFGCSSMTRLADGTYHLSLVSQEERMACEVRLVPSKAPLRHGDGGVVKGSRAEEMFYYSITRCDVTGSLTVDGVSRSVVKGQGWYDHQFGGRAHRRKELDDDPHALKETGLAWHWLGVQLSDGTDVCAYEGFDKKSGELTDRRLVVCGKDGEVLRTRDFELEALGAWRSTRTFQQYPVRYRLRSKSPRLSLELEAVVPQQEFVTVIARPAFWEGACFVRGQVAGKAVTGMAYAERTGFGVVDDLDAFTGAVAAEVGASLERYLPRTPTYEQMRVLVADEHRDWYMSGVDVGSLATGLIAPIREIADRGGKSWRSYAALACCDAVGGDSRRFAHWLAAPEVLHVGSMIVDDVQDRSRRRRGGPAAHLMFGHAQAINAGTAAYFLAERILAQNDLTPEQNLRMYELYFLALRAGHAGQAMDHAGMADLVPHAVETGDTDALERRILACYRLKTAVPVACIASMGAVAGGAADEQEEALAAFMEAVAIGFQITDDVLSLRGFAGGRKARGEDVRNGLVTLPVAEAFRRLPRAERRRLWGALVEKPRVRGAVVEVTSLLEDCGAVDACADRAKELVESGWRALEPVIEPTFSSLMLRAIGWFAVERRR